MRSTIRRRHTLVLVTTIVMAACSTPSPESSPAASTVTPTSDTEVVVSNELSSTVVAGNDPAFESYDDLIAAAAGEDPATMAQLALAEVSADLGPIDGAPVVDPALVDIRNGTDALARLQLFGSSLSATQRDAVERWWAELTSDDALVYRSADDPEYQQAYRDAIDSGLPVEIDPDAAEAAASDAFVEAQPSDIEPQGFRSGTTGQQNGLVGTAQAVARQIDQDVTDATAQQALNYFTSRLGGVTVDMNVYVVASDDARVRADEYARSVTTVGGFFGEPAAGEPGDYDKSRRKCDVFVANVASVAADEPSYLSIVSHEVFHCWQRANAFSFHGSLTLPPFYFEGAATWAGEQFSQAGSFYGRTRMTTFFDRSIYDTGVSPVDGYDGIGFWTQIAQLRGGVDGLWSRLPSINAVAERGEEATFSVAVLGLDGERIAQLASSAAGQPTWGADWNLTGLSVGDGQRSIESRRVGDRAEVFERQQQIFDYSINEADLAGDGPWWIIELATDGLTNAHWDTGETFIITTSGIRQFCTDGSCECPDGTTPASSAEPVPGESDSIQVALTGTAANGASVTITSATADDVCPRVAFSAWDRSTFIDDGPGTVRIFGVVGSGVLRPGDRLEKLNGGPDTGMTILRIVVGAPDVEVDSLAAGESGAIVVLGELGDFAFDQKLVRPTD